MEAMPRRIESQDRSDFYAFSAVSSIGAADSPCMPNSSGCEEAVESSSLTSACRLCSHPRSMIRVPETVPRKVLGNVPRNVPGTPRLWTTCGRDACFGLSTVSEVII
jgi:hypothetical protein